MSTPTDRERPRLLSRFMAAIALPIVLALATTIVTTQWMLGPDITVDTARKFLTGYYKDVFDPTMQKQIWETRQTEGYHNLAGHDWRDFKRFYTETVDQVDLENIYAAGDGGTNQFVVTMRFRRIDGTKTDSESHVFGLICTDKVARLPFRSCGIEDVQIDAVMPSN